MLGTASYMVVSPRIILSSPGTRGTFPFQFPIPIPSPIPSPISRYCQIKFEISRFWHLEHKAIRNNLNWFSPGMKICTWASQYNCLLPATCYLLLLERQPSKLIPKWVHQQRDIEQRPSIITVSFPRLSLGLMAICCRRRRKLSIAELSRLLALSETPRLARALRETRQPLARNQITQGSWSMCIIGLHPVTGAVKVRCKVYKRSRWPPSTTTNGTAATDGLPQQPQ